MNIDQFRRPITISHNKKVKNSLHKTSLINSSTSLKKILTKQDSIEAIYETTSSPRNSIDLTRKRATSRLVNNFTNQNRYTLGVGIRRMSILIDLGPHHIYRINRFQKAVKSVISLLRLISLLRSRNRQLVKISLMKIMNLVQAPQNAGIMNDIGLCEALIDLLDLDPLNYFQIVGMALHGLKLLSLSSQCSLRIASNSHFIQNVDNFLKSYSSITQRLSADIICRCFLQPIQYEELIVKNQSILNLFLRCLMLPHRDIQIRVLSTLESLTYHCDHTSTILSQSLQMNNLEPELFQQLVDIILTNTEKTDDFRYHAIMVIRNILYAMEIDPNITPIVLKSVVNLDHALHKTMRILKGSSRQSAENSVLISRRDQTKRKSSVAMVRRNSLKYLSDASLDINPSVNTQPKPSFQFENIRMMEEVETIMEILWLIHTSPLCQRLLKNSKPISPSVNLATFATTIVK